MFHPTYYRPHISDMSSLEQFENVLNKLKAFKKQPLTLATHSGMKIQWFCFETFMVFSCMGPMKIWGICHEIIP